MKIRALAALVALTAAGTTFAADQVVVTDQGVGTFSFFKPASVRAEVTTLGYGAALAYSLNPTTEMSIGYTGGSVIDDLFGDIKVDGIKYTSDSDISNVHLLGLWRPMGGWFHTSFGAIYQDNTINLKAMPDVAQGKTATFTVNDRVYDVTNASAMVTGKLKWNSDIAPYLGVGFSPSITSRIGLFGEVGAAYMGSPQVEQLSYRGTAAVSCTIKNTSQSCGAGELTPAAINQQLAIAANKLEDLNKYKFVPVAKLGVTLRF